MKKKQLDLISNFITKAGYYKNERIENLMLDIFLKQIQKLHFVICFVLCMTNEIAYLKDDYFFGMHR